MKGAGKTITAKPIDRNVAMERAADARFREFDKIKEEPKSTDRGFKVDDRQAAFRKKFGKSGRMQMPGALRDIGADAQKAATKGESRRGRAMADFLSVKNPTELEGRVFKRALEKWPREEIVKVFEILIEREAPIVSHHTFRDLLSRDQNLYANQIVREANGNIAYRSVDFDIEGMKDEEFWARIDSSPHQDQIEENAAVAMVKMREKFGFDSVG